MRARIPRAWLTATLLFLVAGYGLAAATYRLLVKLETDQARIDFEERFAQRAYALKAALRTPIEVLYSVRSLYDSSTSVTREEFATFTRDALERHPDIRAIEWAPRIEAGNRPWHEQEVREEGLPGYGIREEGDDEGLRAAGPRGEYYPVCFVEPLVGNERALGLDLASEPVRRAALVRAIESGVPVLTDPIALVQEPSSRSLLGCLSVRARTGEGHVVGLVVVVFRIGDLLAEVFPDPAASAPSVHLELVDLDVGGRPEVCFRSSPSSPEPGPDAFVSRFDLQLGGQDWRLIGRPGEAFLAARRSAQPMTMALAVLLLFALLGGVTYSHAKRLRDRALREQDRTISSVLHSLSEGVVVADPQGKILLSNEVAAQLLGHTTAPVAWSSAEGCYLADGETPCPPDRLPLNRALRGETVMEQDLLVRRADDAGGRWLRVSGTPLLDEKRRVLGGVAILRDVTQRRESEEAVRRLSSAVEQTADAVFITDRKGTILYVNPAFEAVTGFPPDEALGRTPRILKSGAHDEAYYRNLWAAINRGDVHRHVVVNRRRNGEIFYSAQTITPMRDPAGRITHFVSVSKDMTEQRRIQEQEIEMRMAADVQSLLYPSRAPKIENLDIAGAVFPADFTCGDYLDYVPAPDGAITLAIGDVAGHGLGPALIMAQTRAYVRSFLEAGHALDEILVRANAALHEDLQNRLFVTLLLGRIDCRTGRLVYASAGHPPGYVLDPAGVVREVLGCTGMPLGIQRNTLYGQASEVALAPGEMIVFFTDGVAESRSPDGTMFGAEGALEIVRAHRHEPAASIVDRVYAAVRAFGEGSQQSDDVTLVVCKCTAS